MGKKTEQLDTVLVLVDIRSVHNVGAIFRTADAAGVAKIFCTGYTPTPKDRFGKVRQDIKKTALGAEETVVWESVPKAGVLLRRLKREGYVIVGLEQDARAVDYRKLKLKQKIALVVGNETEGLSRAVLSVCGAIVEIPMRGKKESLNVSVATGIALFRILDR